MKVILLKLLISAVRRFVGSNLFDYIKLLVIAQLDNNLTGEEKRAAVKLQIDNIKKISIDVVRGTAKEGLVESAQKTSNKYINLAIEVIVAAL